MFRTSKHPKLSVNATSGIARTFPGGWLAHPEQINEEKSAKKMRKMRKGRRNKEKQKDRKRDKCK